jgi:hypothetical protein
MIKNFKWLLLVSLAFAACNSDDDDQPVVQVPVTAGTANFSKYVALGNSLSAGYMDGALYIKGQENSQTKILSDQFKLAGGGEFRIPYMNDNNGALLLGGNIITENRLYFRQTDDDGNPVTPSPTRLPLDQFPPTNEIGVPLTYRSTIWVFRAPKYFIYWLRDTETWQACHQVRPIRISFASLHRQVRRFWPMLPHKAQRFSPCGSEITTS